LVAFPERAKVGHVPQSILDTIAVVYGPGIVILAILAQPFLFRYRISRERHAEILRELAEQRSRDVPAAPS
jgi:Na+/melibiose symporter-like transporter